ncbi:hypothetical protein Csa_011801 [Cucumis sativus]|nr:hypothetical protein Csa_011801 [Cucumis sativus]
MHLQPPQIPRLTQPLHDDDRPDEAFSASRLHPSAIAALFYHREAVPSSLPQSSVPRASPVPKPIMCISVSFEPKLRLFG